MKNCLESRNLFYVKLFTKWVISLEREKYNLSSDIKYNNLQSIVKEWAKIAQIALYLLLSILNANKTYSYDMLSSFQLAQKKKLEPISKF